MFGRMMNNYYYGKSGKGDFRKEDMPSNRWQLFMDTLRTRFSALVRLNLLYALIFLPTMIVLMLNFTNFLTTTTNIFMIQDNDYASFVAMHEENGQEINISEEKYNVLREAVLYPSNDYKGYVEEMQKQGKEIVSEEEFKYFKEWYDHFLYSTLLWLIPCLAITGPFTAGLSYVTRNWARDEHAFIWTDFKDAVKENWKQSLILSVITSLLPAAVYVGWRFYGQMASQNVIMIVPQVLVVLVTVIWALSITYMHPLVVSYELKTMDVIRNGLLLGVTRLPMSVGIRLLHCVPALIGAAIAFLWEPMYAMLFLFAWYFLIGFSLSRFITASYTNAVFDKYINSRIEGAKVNRGLRSDEDEDGEDDPDEEAEKIPAGEGNESN